MMRTGPTIRSPILYDQLADEGRNNIPVSRLRPYAEGDDAGMSGVQENQNNIGAV